MTSALKSEVSHRTILALPVGAVANQRQRYLSLLVDVTTEQLMDSSRSVQLTDALPLELLITVSAIGELSISELSTSPTQLGDSSPMSPSPQDSSKSWSSAKMAVEMMEQEPEDKPSPTPLQLYGWNPEHGQHAHRGSPYANCNQCNMPHGAAQHRKITEDGPWPITMADEMRVRQLMYPEAKPFA
jgi:hypothetical protein